MHLASRSMTPRQPPSLSVSSSVSVAPITSLSPSTPSRSSNHEHSSLDGGLSHGRLLGAGWLVDEESPFISPRYSEQSRAWATDQTGLAHSPLQQLPAPSTPPGCWNGGDWDGELLSSPRIAPFARSTFAPGWLPQYATSTAQRRQHGTSAPPSLQHSSRASNTAHSTTEDRPAASVRVVASARQRPRSAALTKQQRAELRKTRHRAIDLRRRLREQSAINALQRLNGDGERSQVQPTSAGSSPPSSSSALTAAAEDDEEDEDEEAEAEAGTEATARKRNKNKSRILEETARRYKELQCEVARLTHANRAQNDTISALMAAQLYCYPSHTPDLSLLSPHLAARVSGAVLHSSSLLSSSLSMLLMSAETGCVLDVNERTLRSTGWERSHLLGRRMTPPWSSIPAVPTDTWSDEMRARLDNEGVWVDGADGCMVPAKLQPQYQSVMQLTIDLHAGRIDHVQSVALRLQLRSAHTRSQTSRLYVTPSSRAIADSTRLLLCCCLLPSLLLVLCRDGHVYEVSTSVWLGGAEDAQQRMAGSRVHPTTVTMICSLADAVLVSGTTASHPTKPTLS